VDLPCDIREDYGIWVGRNEVTGVKWGKDIGGNVQLIFSTRGEECLLGAKVKESEASGVLDLV
jgi:hypothetical protein